MPAVEVKPEPPLFNPTRLRPAQKHALYQRTHHDECRSDCIENQGFWLPLGRKWRPDADGAKARTCRMCQRDSSQFAGGRDSSTDRRAAVTSGSVRRRPVHEADASLRPPTSANSLAPHHRSHADGIGSARGTFRLNSDSSSLSCSQGRKDRPCSVSVANAW